MKHKRDIEKMQRISSLLQITPLRSEMIGHDRAVLVVLNHAFQLIGSDYYF
jgi:hypothetical protein